MPEIPPGMTLRDTLRGHTNVIVCADWSPNGRTLATGSSDLTVRLWDVQTGQTLRTLKGHSGEVGSVAFAPNGRTLATGSNDHTVQLWDVQTGQTLRTLKGHSGEVGSVAFAPNGRTLATGSNDHTVQLWDVQTGQTLRTLEGHSGSVYSVAFAPNGRTLATGSNDRTVRLWNMQTGQELQTLEGHSGTVYGVGFAPEGHTLATGSHDRTVRLWRLDAAGHDQLLEGHTEGLTEVSFSPGGRLLISLGIDALRFWRADDGRPLVRLDGPFLSTTNLPLVFHPSAQLLATPGEEGNTVRIWRLDMDALLGAETKAKAARYTNAKVVLVGETSAGKTCLGRALMGESFQPQESTHGMTVWTFQNETVADPDGGETTRETMLWDLAGQTDYQVVHQLFLDETALGIVLFDPKHPDEPFAGVGHWAKALRKVAGADCPHILVAGRVDRAGPAVTTRDIEAYRAQHGFSAYIPTSAKRGKGIEELKQAIARAIPWDRLPCTSSPQLWQDIREYLLQRRAGEDPLSRRGDLREAFQKAQPDAVFTEAEFDTVLGHAQAQGLVWRLSFGDFVLMRPEMLNNYASAIVRAARKHKHGLGCVREQDVLQALMDFEDMKRIENAETERVLLNAVVELLLTREIALREGELLVFPSKFNRQHPDYPAPPRREVVYEFGGPAEIIYSTLVVRLAYSGAFDVKDLYKNAAEFKSAADGLCGFVLESSEGAGKISLFFGEQTSVGDRVLFVRFIHEHLQVRALPETFHRERVYRCGNPKCGEEVQDRRAVQRRLEEGKDFIICSYCDARIPLRDLL